MLTKEKKNIINNLLSGEKSLTELAEKCKVSKPSLLWQLSDLEQQGLVEKRMEKTQKGREAIFLIKRHASFFLIDQSRSILIETNSEFEPKYLLLEQVKNVEFKLDLHSLLERLSRKLSKDDFIILFGSVAQEQGTWKSDIDIAVLSSKDIKWQDEIEGLIAEVSQKAKHQIKPKFIDLVKFRGDTSLFIREIKEKGIILWGDLFNVEVWKEMKRYSSI